MSSLRSLLRLAALAIVPAYKMTPISGLLREADLPFPKALLDSTLQRAAVRYAGLDPSHPITRVLVSSYVTRGVVGCHGAERSARDCQVGCWKDSVLWFASVEEGGVEGGVDFTATHYLSLSAEDGTLSVAIQG